MLQLSLSIPAPCSVSEGRVLSSAGLKAQAHRGILLPKLVQGMLSSAKDIASILLLIMLPLWPRHGSYCAVLSAASKAVIEEPCTALVLSEVPQREREQKGKALLLLPLPELHFTPVFPQTSGIPP